MQFIILYLLALGLLINPIQSQEDQACTPSDNNIITIGAKVHICAKILTANGTYVYAFSVTVDKITALSITNIGDILSNSQNATLQLQYQNVNTTEQIVKNFLKKIIQDASKGIYRNPISIILEASNGNLTQIYFQGQDCSSCLSSNQKTCINDQCYSAGSLADTNSFIIYLSWIGTDIVGSHFISHTIRLKKLGIFAQGDVYKSALIITKTS